MLNILHITPHMGGGVGNVISRLATYCDERINNIIVLIEEPIKYNFIDKLKEIEEKVLICPDKTTLEKAIIESDLIIVHWWHHPKISKFLYELPQIPLRLMIWTHISNLTVPALNSNMLVEATRVLFTTEASYKADVFKSVPNYILKKKTGVVYGCGGFDDFPRIDHREHEEFNIGYLGLVDFSKMHPDFVEFCKQVNIPEAKFILVGDAPAKQCISEKIKEKRIKNQFIYTDYVEDVKPILSQFDVFGYPLMPYHTCTTENAILEAMAAEVTPVLLKQLTENYIVEDGKTGFLVSSKEEYGRVMRYLYNNPDIRQKVGESAREYVIKKHTLKKFLDSFYENCEIAMNCSKKIINFKKIIGETPAEWFLSCLGKDYDLFKQSFALGYNNQTQNIKKAFSSISPLLKQQNKSSLFHYQREFKDDTMLNVWANINNKF
ncbi:glycosyltransferase family 4 protein [Clostridium cylindrosporum]|uniref:Glycosyl transferase group 1 n=1 Tax=Clostridium cylindrosporum DSM 605 TaxID=1121307 RepID=A0A0J8D9W8_CLOCY|nr:glycosyltransferase family 4 protein [Clostridium cylindrosporum]KMT22637.1 glycosyl transferase group 1 [Clostridium cylindrosporum DSM 605]